MKSSDAFLRNLATFLAVVLGCILGIFLLMGILLRSLDGSCSVIHKFANDSQYALVISKCWFDDGFYTNYDVYNGEEKLVESARVVLGSYTPENVELRYIASSHTSVVAVVAVDEPYDPLIIHDFSSNETWAFRGDGPRAVLQARLEQAYPQLRAQAQLQNAFYLQARSSLDLSHKHVAGIDLLYLLHRQNIRNLSLAYTDISDADMAYIGQLTFLTTLDLSGTRVSDNGISFLQSLTNLRTLTLKDTQVTEAGEQQLQTMLPQVEKSLLL